MKHFYLFGALLLTNSVYSMDETISIDSIVTNLNTAIESKDADKVAYWNNHLHMLGVIDYKLFNDKQQSQYRSFSSEFFQKTYPLLSKRNADLDMRTHQEMNMKERDIVTAALIEKFNQDKCTIDWTKVLGSNIKTAHSPEELKQLRIKTLEESHIPKPHSSN
jgi:hypothetical protein